MSFVPFGISTRERVYTILES